MKLFDLHGRRALVVGAGGDLGRRACRVLGSLGAAVVAADHPGAREALEVTSARLDADGVDHALADCDVTSEEAVEACVSAGGGFDVLVNAAGVMLRKPAVETGLDEWRRVLDVNLTGAWLVNRAAARTMGPAGRGKIVNIASVYADRVGPVPESAYYASKAGVANLTRAMAAELGPAGVHVNCLALGVFYPTNMTAPLGGRPETLRWMEERTLLGRLGDPERDLDGPLALLATAASDYMTGQVIYVDGGWSAW